MTALRCIELNFISRFLDTVVTSCKPMGYQTPLTNFDLGPVTLTYDLNQCDLDARPLIVGLTLEFCIFDLFFTYDIDLH